MNGSSRLYCSILAIASLILSVPFAEAQSRSAFPLEQLDRSSPRATLLNYMATSAEASRAIRSGDPRNEIMLLFSKADSCLNVTGVAPSQLAFVTAESGLVIYEILIRAGVPEEHEIPGPDELRSNDLSAWRIPRTDIIIRNVEDESGLSEWLFDVDNPGQLLSSYELVKHLPNVTAYPDGNYESYVQQPTFGIPNNWTNALPGWANQLVFRNPLWKWIAILLALVAAGLIVAIAEKLGKRINARLRKHSRGARPASLLVAVVLIALLVAMQWLAEWIIGLRFEAAAAVSKIYLAITFAALVYLIFALVEYIAESIIEARNVRERSVNAHLIRVSARIVAIISGVIIIVQATNFLGMPIAPVLAGLGIGGLAVALAARPTLENIIGGFTLFADKPVRVGDYCAFGDREGTVEEIGLRSTRIRTRDDKLVTVPNADFSQMSLVNNARIRERLYRPTIGIRYDTSPDQLRFILSRLREMLLSHPRVSRKELYVRFIGFGGYSLNIEMFVNLKTGDWRTSLAIIEDLNLRIMEIVDESGSSFAFPSQTAYLARDRAPDSQKASAAERQVADWRAENNLPFPDFSQDDKAELAGRLDYPPAGSVGASKDSKN